MNVWTYWEGPQPEYIQVCLASLKERMGATILIPETVDCQLGDALHPNYKKLPEPALRADCIRAALLAVHGGWWVDADTLAWGSVEALHRTYATAAKPMYTVWTKLPIRVLNGYIYFPPGHPLAENWLWEVNRCLTEETSLIKWCSLGEVLLTKRLFGNPTAIQFPRELVLPIDIDYSVETFFSNEDPEDYVVPGAVCYGLNHSWFMYHKPEDMMVPRSAWGTSPLLIHKLLTTTTESLKL